MFKRKQQEDEDLWPTVESEPDWDYEATGAVRRSKAKVIVVALVLVVVIAGAVFLGTRLVAWSTPEYAAQDWFEALWELNGEKVLDCTCDDQLEVVMAFNTGAALQMLDLATCSTIATGVWSAFVFGGSGATGVEH